MLRERTTPKITTITFTFPDGQRVGYKSDNVILDDFMKERIRLSKEEAEFYFKKYRKWLV